MAKVDVIGTSKMSVSLLAALSLAVGCSIAPANESPASNSQSELKGGVADGPEPKEWRIETGADYNPGCAGITAALAGIAKNITCFASDDLTTNNPATTPPDNSLAGLKPGAFTPRTDRQIIAPEPPYASVITKKVPGVQISASFADKDEARFVIRLPNTWNGKLVTGAPSSTRSEFGLDYAFSDHVVQQGYAFIATNKGMYNAYATSASDPLGCQLSPPGGTHSGVYLHFFFHEAQNSFREWMQRTVQAAQIGKRLAQVQYGSAVRKSYAVGVSAGGWTVRHVLENYPKHFDGGVDWEGVLFTGENNLMRDYPVALKNWPEYRASGYDVNSPANQALMAYGYSDEIAGNPHPKNPFSPRGSYHETHANNYWQLLHCFAARKVDPTYSGPWADYNYGARDAALGLTAKNADAITSGDLKRPLITVSGTADNICLMKTDIRVYHDLAVKAGKGDLHRSYEVQNGNHIDFYKQRGFPNLEFVAPHAAASFDALDRWVDGREAPPAGQCIPRGGSLSSNPSADGRPEQCEKLYVE